MPPLGGDRTTLGRKSIREMARFLGPLQLTEQIRTNDQDG
jgi:hypothetical protein